MTRERTYVGSLFRVKADGTGPFYTSLYAPADRASAVLDPGIVYAYAEGETPEDAIYAAREKLWKGL